MILFLLLPAIPAIWFIVLLRYFRKENKIANWRLEQMRSTLKNCRQFLMNGLKAEDPRLYESVIALARYMAEMEAEAERWYHRD